jgi:hypothetical protein
MTEGGAGPEWLRPSWRSVSKRRVLPPGAGTPSAPTPMRPRELGRAHLYFGRHWASRSLISRPETACACYPHLRTEAGPPAHQTGLASRGQRHLEHPVPPRRSAEPFRMPTRTVWANPAGPAPSHPPTPAAYRHRASNVNPVDGLPVRKPLQALQRHHRRDHRWRHRPATDRGQQVGEQIVGGRRSRSRNRNP